MWWASVAEEEWPLDEKERQEIEKDFDASADGLGDRRQEVVFIGVRMDKAAITALLDACLLTDTEMDSYEAALEPRRRRVRRELIGRSAATAAASRRRAGDGLGGREGRT